MEVIEFWIKFLVDYIGDMADLVGTSNINAHRGKGQRALKSLFRQRKRLLKSKEDDVKFIPGVGKIRIVPNEDQD